MSKSKINPAKVAINAIGSPGVGKGLNFYLFAREIELGKSLAEEVEHSSRLPVASMASLPLPPL